jgi:hypothetical protein
MRALAMRKGRAPKGKEQVRPCAKTLDYVATDNHLPNSCPPTRAFLLPYTVHTLVQTVLHGPLTSLGSLVIWILIAVSFHLLDL